MTNSPITEYSIKSKALARMDGDCVIFNTAAIKRATIARVRRWEKTDMPMTWCEAETEAWNSAECFANDIRTVDYYRNRASEAERTVATLAAINRPTPQERASLSLARTRLVTERAAG